MIRPEPNFLQSLDALERSIRALSSIDAPLPQPASPDVAVLAAWLAPYEAWPLPQLYVDYIRRYGGVTCNVPSVGIGIRPLATLLDYRRKRESIGEVFQTRFVLLSNSNIDGDLCLVLSDGRSARVALMNDDDDILYVADSLGLYLWSAYFYLAEVAGARFRERITFSEVARDGVDSFNLKLAVALDHAGFELLGADSRRICCQREGTRVYVGVRGANISVSLGDRTSNRSVKQAEAEVLVILDRCRGT